MGAEKGATTWKRRTTRASSTSSPSGSARAGRGLGEAASRRSAAAALRRVVVAEAGEECGGCVGRWGGGAGGRRRRRSSGWSAICASVEGRSFESRYLMLGPLVLEPWREGEHFSYTPSTLESEFWLLSSYASKGGPSINPHPFALFTDGQYFWLIHWIIGLMQQYSCYSISIGLVLSFIIQPSKLTKAQCYYNFKAEDILSF